MDVDEVGDDIEEARDKPKPLFVNTRLANLLAQEADMALPGSKRDHRRMSAGPLSDSSDRKKSEDGEMFEDMDVDKPATRPRSSSGGTSLLVLRKASRPMSVEVMGRLNSDEDPYQQYLNTQTCYDLLPHIAKVILLDNHLTVKRSFVALMEHNLEAAPVWDGTEEKVISLLTKTDFLQMLYQSHSTGQKDLGLHPISWWFTKGYPSQSGSDQTHIKGGGRPKGVKSNTDTLAQPFKKLIQLDANDKLTKAVEVFCLNSVHWIPVQEHDTRGLLYLLSLEAVLRNLHKLLGALPMPSWMRLPLRTLNLGTWSNLEKIDPDMTIFLAIQSLIRSRLSCLPVVDTKTKRLKNCISKSDIFNILATTSSNIASVMSETERYAQLLESTVEETVGEKSADVIAVPPPSAYADKPKEALKRVISSRVPWCTECDNLVVVIEIMVKMSCRTVYVVDKDGFLSGVVSIRDVMRFIALRDRTKNVNANGVPIMSNGKY